MMNSKNARPSTRLHRLVIWLLRFVPLFRFVEAELERVKQDSAKQLRVLRERHQAEMEETARKVDAIIKRCSVMEFSRERGERYAVILQFEPRMMMSGLCTSDELRFIAERIGRQVEAEIASARFIASARDIERHRRDV